MNKNDPKISKIMNNPIIKSYLSNNQLSHLSQIEQLRTVIMKLKEKHDKKELEKQIQIEQELLKKMEKQQRIDAEKKNIEAQNKAKRLEYANKKAQKKNDI